MQSYVKPLLIVVLLLVVCAFVTYVYVHIPNDSPQADTTKSLQASASHVFTDLQGNSVTFDDYKGKVRVVNSWASWTPFSAEELPNLEKLSAEFKDKNVVVLAINRKEPKEVVAQYLQTLQPVPQLTFIIDLTDYFYASEGGFSMPETVFYDKDGIKVFHARGSLTLDQMRTYTNQALEHTK